jgi:PhnB protein
MNQEPVASNEVKTMSKHWKPPEYSSVSPYLMVRNAQGVIDFLKQVLGAIELRRFDMPDGTLMHGEVRIDDSVIMLAEGSEAHPAFTAWLHVYVRDVDATYRRALEQGAESVQEPRQREGDPDRRGGVKDPAGNVWWISTQMEP